MTGRTHGIVATAAGAGLAATSMEGAAAVAACVVLATLGGLAPDIDHPRSTATNHARPLHWLFRALVSNPLTWLLFGVRRARRWASHRSGVAHGLPALALSTAAVAGLLAWGGLPIAASVGWAAGYGTHLLLDGCTAGGVALLSPFNDRRIGFLPRPLRRLIGHVERRLT